MNIDANGNGIIDSEELEEELEEEEFEEDEPEEELLEEEELEIEDESVDEEVDSVDTSDNTNVVLYLMLALLSLSVILYKRKRINR